MPKPRDSSAHVAILLATILAFLPGLSASAPAGTGDFEQVFNAEGEPSWIHYGADYIDRHGTHHLEVWRDHDMRILRKTDDRIEVNALRLGDDIRFAISDMVRHTVTTVDRLNLVRVGLFVDWFSQGHAVVRPTGTYKLSPLGTSEQILGRSCSMWRLTSLASNSKSDICWDDALKLPLSIRGTDDRIVWRLTAVDDTPFPDSVFSSSASDLAPTDMNADFSGDAD